MVVLQQVSNNHSSREALMVCFCTVCLHEVFFDSLVRAKDLFSSAVKSGKKNSSTTRICLCYPHDVEQFSQFYRHGHQETGRSCFAVPEWQVDFVDLVCRLGLIFYFYMNIHFLTALNQKMDPYPSQLWPGAALGVMQLSVFFSSFGWDFFNANKTEENYPRS